VHKRVTVVLGKLVFSCRRFQNGKKEQQLRNILKRIVTGDETAGLCTI
jgi:hypothetical protein